MNSIKDKSFFNKIKTNLVIKFVFILFIFLGYIKIVNAQVLINEIMYNLDGSDSGREWVEIFNNGDKSVDISGWRFFEDDTNHKLKLVDGKNSNFILPSNSFAIIIDNFDKFSKDNPNFSGLVFDSSFSLSNKGEKIALKDSDLNIVDSVTYIPDKNPKDSEYSLQLIDGRWKLGVPTLGEPNSSNKSRIFLKEKNNSQVDKSVYRNSNFNKNTYFDNYKIYANAGKNKIIAVGSSVDFRGQALGLKKEPLLKAIYFWTFGDGSFSQGKNITHTYRYPGDYVVVLNVSSGEYTASDRILVKVVPVNLFVSKVDPKKQFVELFNKSKYELDLSGWMLCSDLKCFIFPVNTIILSGKKLILPTQITGLESLSIKHLYLKYPNGEVLTNPVLETNKKIILKSKTTLRKNISISKTNSLQKVKKNKFMNSNQKVTQKKESSQLALAGGINKNSKEDDLFNKWTFSFLGLILISIGSVLFVRKFGEEADENEIDGSQLKPEDFKIID